MRSDVGEHSKLRSKHWLWYIYRLGTQRRDKRRRCKGDVATSMREEGRPEWEIAREKRRSGSVFRVAEVFLIGFLSFFFFWVQFFQSFFFDCLGFFCYGPPCIFIIKRWHKWLRVTNPDN
jgi:hypothetical protein